MLLFVALVAFSDCLSSGVQVHGFGGGPLAAAFLDHHVSEHLNVRPDAGLQPSLQFGDPELLLLSARKVYALYMLSLMEHVQSKVKTRVVRVRV